jgi:sugar-specific transcriptional regulator TrmB
MQAQAEEAASTLADELSGVAKRASQLEGIVRGRDKDIDALQRLVDAAKVCVCACVWLSVHLGRCLVLQGW